MMCGNRSLKNMKLLIKFLLIAKSIVVTVQNIPSALGLMAVMNCQNEPCEI